METKLTLRLRKSTIEKAKEYAQEHQISLSKLVELYLESVTTSADPENEISPLVESLSGVIQLEPEYDYKEDYSHYLSEKHL